MRRATRPRYLGRADRIVLSILLILAVVATLLYYAMASPVVEASALPREVAEVADTILTPEYVGPPPSMRHSSERKFAQRRVLDLNRVDSLTLLRVPGIGPAFAGRILSLRQRLGGYYTVLQLQEVYGMDEDKYLALRGWFAIRTKPTRYRLDSLKADELPRHPYLSWTHRREMSKLLYRHGHIRSWAQLMRSGAFSRDDSVRLSPYFIGQSVDSLVAPK